jgi:glycosyltransferase involved in cell wall biosynthesis
MDSSSSRLKALHICQRDDTATGGAARVAVEYVKRLSNYGVDAHCLFLYGSLGYFGSELGDLAHYLAITDSREVLKFGRLISFIREFKPDVIHHHDGLLWSHLLTFFHPGILKVAHAHLGATNDVSATRSNLAAWVQRQSTDLLICITEDTRTSQVQNAGYQIDQTQVLYNGVDRARFDPASRTKKITARKQFGLPDDVSIVGYIGRLHCGMKGTDDFLRVISLLSKNFWALIVGNGSDAEYLKQLAHELGIAERVVFTGTLNETKMAYHALDVFCLTSHDEPFGLVVAEAMSCQVPVIGFACTGGVSELLSPKTGSVILSRDLDGMAKEIIEAVEHSELWHQRQENARSLLERNHDWDKNTLNLANLYKKTLYQKIK